jgi:hypothetical protein
VEKLRWAEKEWRELDRQLAEGADGSDVDSEAEESETEDEEPHAFTFSS